jgi:plastocyanin
LTFQVLYPSTRLASMVLAMAMMAACSASPAESFEVSECAQPDENDVITLKAEDVKFDFSCIAAPANRAFTIHFSSRDGTDHNVAIYESAAKATEYMRGEAISFGEFIDYPVDALAAGENYFDCTIHPEMNGPLFVVAP